MSLRARSLSGAWMLGALAYVGGVGALAVLGFTSQTSWLIIAAALVALPASIVAVPGYYLAYGLVALLPGANPSSSAGSGSCSAAGACHGSGAGATVWFDHLTQGIGITALVAAAVLNVLLLRLLTGLRRNSSDPYSLGPS